MPFDIAPYSGAISSVSDLFNGILKRVLPEKMSEADAAKLQQEITMELLKADWSAVQSQLQINTEEAKHDSVFVAGWRPFVGWVCGAAFAYNFIFQPLFLFIVTTWKWDAPPLPTLDFGPMMTVLLGMLGLGAMRSYEKVKGETTTATKVGA